MSCKPRPISAAVAGIALVLLASGCAPVDVGLGEAQHYDMAVQTIDPDPVYPEYGAKPGDNGDKAAHATKRYRTDAVKPIQTLSSQSSSGGGTGSSSGSGPN
jgi:hypothetical protein